MSENNPRRLYEATAKQLDRMTTSVITLLLGGFIVSQQFIDEPTQFNQWAAIFAISTLFIHYLSFVTAHFTQIAKIKEAGRRKQFYMTATRILNGLVCMSVFIMFVISVIIIINKGV
jgi:O-antigen/teichoic acid export membrane protein